MGESKKEYLAWVNGGTVGTSWRAKTIEEAVKTCTIVAVQDWGGLRGTEVPVGVYDVTGQDRIILSGSGGSVLTEEQTEIPPLFLVKVNVPALRKNGKAYGEHYRSKVQKATHAALQKAMAKWRKEQLVTAVESDPAVQELLAEDSRTLHGFFRGTPLGK